MKTDKFFESIYAKFERVIVISLAIAIMIAIAYATILFFVILIKTVLNPNPILDVIQHNPDSGSPLIHESISILQSGLYHIFGGFLLILLGIELINTVKTFAIENHIKIKSILAIAIIAAARHLIILDYHDTEALTIFAAGFVVIALTIGYFLLNKSNK